MPDSKFHLRKIEADFKTAKLLWDEGDEHLGWMCTVLFYVALHAVEAMFFEDPMSPSHFSSHSNRDAALRHSNRHVNIWRHYKPLRETSEVARYLQGHHGDFNKYMSKSDVESKVIKHHLYKVGQSADGLVNGALFSGQWNPAEKMGL